MSLNDKLKDALSAVTDELEELGWHFGEGLEAAAHRQEFKDILESHVQRALFSIFKGDLRGLLRMLLREDFQTSWSKNLNAAMLDFEACVYLAGIGTEVDFSKNVVDGVLQYRNKSMQSLFKAFYLSHSDRKRA
jgi:hypothetical protein